MESVERIALSLVLSIAIAALIGLILNYTSWGINLNSVLISLTIFVVVTSIIAWFRQRKLPDEEKFAFHIDLTSWGKQSLLSKTISVILVIVILGTIGVLIYTIATPKTGEKSTEFYILGLEGKAVDYPEDLKLGDTGKVILGIINREQKLVNYRVEIKVDGILNGTFGPITLQLDEKSESEVGFTPPKMGDHQKIEFLLYKNDQSNAYSEVYFWVNVK
jgi:uncharacterized membrane protein